MWLSTRTVPDKLKSLPAGTVRTQCSSDYSNLGEHAYFVLRKSGQCCQLVDKFAAEFLLILCRKGQLIGNVLTNSQSAASISLPLIMHQYIGSTVYLQYRINIKYRCCKHKKKSAKSAVTLGVTSPIGAIGIFPHQYIGAAKHLLHLYFSARCLQVDANTRCEELQTLIGHCLLIHLE